MIVLFVFKNTLEISHMPMIKLIFNAHYLNCDDMVCSDKSFFKLNTKLGKLLQISMGPGANDVYCFLAKDDE